MNDSFGECTIQKVFNNNVIMVDSAAGEKILVGRGIGFGAKPGKAGEIPGVEKIFGLEQLENADKFRTLAAHVDEEVIGACVELIQVIISDLGEQLDERIHVALIDHIAFLVHRLKNGDQIINPFILDIESLYSEEYHVARGAIAFLQERLNMPIPDEEIGFIALHIYSARKHHDLGRTLKFTFLCNTIAEMLEDELDLTIDRSSRGYARFLTHLRFAVAQAADGKSTKNELLGVIKESMPRQYALACQVAQLIKEDLDLQLDDDEIGYIAIHFHRLAGPPRSNEE